MRVTSWLAAVLSLAAAACGSDDEFESTPVDVSGSYTVSVTNKSNGCNFTDWQQDETTSGIPITITQDGETITITIDGLVGSAVALWLGASKLEGNVDGDRVHATYFGTRSFTQATCTYSINAEMDATLTGDSLQGVIRYKPKTNGSPDCGALESCETLQEFAGSRPPK